MLANHPPSSSTMGLQSCHMIYQRYEREHQRLQESYQKWLNRREAQKTEIINKINSIKESNSESKQSAKALAKLNERLAAHEEEDLEIPDPKFMEQFPHAPNCQRAAYRKLAFENALQASENKRKIAEDNFNTALATKKLSQKLTPEGLKEASETPAEQSALPTPPLTPTPSSQGTPKPMGLLKRFDAYWSKLESGPGMTKTFTPRNDLNAERPSSHSRWSPRAKPFEPRRSSAPSTS